MTENVVRHRAVVVSAVQMVNSAVTTRAVRQNAVEATAAQKVRSVAMAHAHFRKIVIVMIYRDVLIFRTLCARNAKIQDMWRMILVYLV